MSDFTDDPGHRFTDVSFSPDGRIVAGSRLSTECPGAETEQVKFWDWKRGEIVRTLPSEAFTIAFSRDRERLATASPEGPVRGARP